MPDSSSEPAPAGEGCVAAAVKSLSPAQAIEGWDQSLREMALVLRNTRLDGEWLARLERVTQRMLALARRDLDTALYLLFQHASQDSGQYSARHAVLCAIVCEQCAAWFDWADDEVHSLVCAALTMNVSMSALHDALTRHTGPLSELQRREIDDHAVNSAALLVQAGVTDTLWLEVVRAHHKPAPAMTEQPLPPATRLAQLLRRVDIYTAKLSRRSSRAATTPSIAARDACLDDSGLPDAIGATILRMLGLFPPGSFVRLASGEVGVVVRRGVKAHTPIVAVLRRADGGVSARALRRDTAFQRYAVVRGMSTTDVNIRFQHERVLQAP